MTCASPTAAGLAKSREVSHVRAGGVKLGGVLSASERLAEVRIHGELASEIVPMRLIESSSDSIPVEYAKPDRPGATGELVLLYGVQDRAPPALTTLELLTEKLRSDGTSPARASWLAYSTTCRDAKSAYSPSSHSARCTILAFMTEAA